MQYQSRNVLRNWKCCMESEYGMTVVCCKDCTCKHNNDGFCRCDFPQMEVGADSNNQICVMCVSYQNRSKEDD